MLFSTELFPEGSLLKHTVHHNLLTESHVCTKPSESNNQKCFLVIELLKSLFLHSIMCDEKMSLFLMNRPGLCQVYISHTHRIIENSSFSQYGSRGFTKQMISILLILCYNGSLLPPSSSLLYFL
jgi:hypothetical protein